MDLVSKEKVVCNKNQDPGICLLNNSRDIHTDIVAYKVVASSQKGISNGALDSKEIACKRSSP